VIQVIAFEICMLGQYGLDINNPTSSDVSRTHSATRAPAWPWGCRPEEVRPAASQEVHHCPTLGTDPRNPVALKNLGDIYGQEGDSLRALYNLRRSFECDPHDPQTVYGLAFTYMEPGDVEQAQKRFGLMLDMPAPEELRALAKNGLRGELPSGGSRLAGCAWTAVFYPAGP
jgi:tetratricopeptide (TPR) repeat protein